MLFGADQASEAEAIGAEATFTAEWMAIGISGNAAIFIS
jgi:hypothetical protein